MSGFGDFNFDGLKKLGNDLDKMRKAFPGFVEECLKELARRLLAKTMERTPADTGDLRKGWTVGRIKQTGEHYEIELVNPVKYARYVEYGHRSGDQAGWKQGRFMLTESVAEIRWRIYRGNSPLQCR